MDTDAGLMAIMRSGVRMITAELTDGELAALYMAARLDQDPRGRPGYEKVVSLFTEGDGTRMHASTLEALDVVVLERLKP